MVHQPQDWAASAAEAPSARRNTDPSHTPHAGRRGLGRLNALGGDFLEPCAWSVWFEDKKEKRPL